MKTANTMSKAKFDHGIIRYLNGDRPYPEVRPVWFVTSSKGVLLPLKYVYALAISVLPSRFHTYDAKRAARNAGYQTIRVKAPEGIAADFEKTVAKSLLDDAATRASRLSRAPNKPVKLYSIQASYVRNPDVVAEVLFQSGGKCEKCGSNAPFKKTDGSPYLEVHHKITLASGGDDTVANAIALCPNCHREIHYA